MPAEASGQLLLESTLQLNQGVLHEAQLHLALAEMGLLNSLGWRLRYLTGASLLAKQFSCCTQQAIAHLAEGVHGTGAKSNM